MQLVRIRLRPRGGRGGVMREVISTISCRDCRTLHDALVYDVPGENEDPSRRGTTPSCPISKEHRWEYWEHPGPCPECGAPLSEGDMRAMAD